MTPANATTLVIPGQPATGAASGAAGLTEAWTSLFGNAGGPVLWALAFVVVGLGLWAATNGRRRRRIDPCELAFRRVTNAQGWSRSQVRALRRAASSAGLSSPVGLALSPTLTARVLAEADARGRGR